MVIWKGGVGIRKANDGPSDQLLAEGCLLPPNRQIVKISYVIYQ